MLKKRACALALSCVMAVTLLSGLAYAYDDYLGYPGSFNFTLPAKGKPQVGDAVKKTVTGNADFFVDHVENSSGLYCYVNVRTSDGQTRAGTAAQVAGRGHHYVSYRSGYGVVNTSYCPSAQTDGDSAVSAWMYGTWLP